MSLEKVRGELERVLIERLAYSSSPIKSNDLEAIKAAIIKAKQQGLDISTHTFRINSSFDSQTDLMMIASNHDSPELINFLSNQGFNFDNNPEKIYDYLNGALRQDTIRFKKSADPLQTFNAMFKVAPNIAESDYGNKIFANLTNITTLDQKVVEKKIVELLDKNYTPSPEYIYALVGNEAKDFKSYDNHIPGDIVISRLTLFKDYKTINLNALTNTNHLAPIDAIAPAIKKQKEGIDRAKYLDKEKIPHLQKELADIGRIKSWLLKNTEAIPAQQLIANAFADKNKKQAGGVSLIDIAIRNPQLITPELTKNHSQYLNTIQTLITDNRAIFSIETDTKTGQKTSKNMEYAVKHKDSRLVKVLLDQHVPVTTRGIKHYLKAEYPYRFPVHLGSAGDVSTSLKQMLEALPHSQKSLNLNLTVWQDRVKYDTILDRVLDARIGYAKNAVEDPKYKEVVEAYNQAIVLLKQHGAKRGIDIYRESDEYKEKQQYADKNLEAMRKMASLDVPVNVMLEKNEIEAPLAKPLSNEDLNKELSHIPKLPASKTKDREKVTLVVMEERGKSLHHDHTTRTATGTLQRLNTDGSLRYTPVVKMKQLPNEFDIFSKASPLSLARYAIFMREDVKNGQVVFSYSMAHSKGRGDTEELKIDYFRQILDKGMPVVYIAVGNDRHPSSPQQEEDHPLAYSPRAVLVGAATKQNGNWVMEKYSEDSVLFSGPLPKAEIDGKYQKRKGTSFSTPIVAAEHTALQSKYPSLSAEDIRFAMVATTDRNILDSDKFPIVFEDNGARSATGSAGLKYSDRTGFGVVNPLRAELLLKEMASYKQQGLKAGQTILHKVSVGKNGKYDPATGNYTYSVTLGGDMPPSIIQSVTLDNADRTKVAITSGVDPNAEKHYRNTNYYGHLTLHRFYGQQVQTGHTFTITSKYPLSDDVQLKLSMVDAKGSVIEKTLEKLPELVAKVNKDMKKNAKLQKALNEADIPQKDESNNLKEPVITASLQTSKNAQALG